MHSLLALATPLALLLPFLGGGTGETGAELGGTDTGAADAQEQGKTARQVILTAPQYPASHPEAFPFDAFQDDQVTHQIRIEQRVIIRVSPSRPRQQMLADLPQQSVKPRYEERKMEKCIPVSNIAGVQTGSGNRLLLFMRDARIVSAQLEKACRSRDFYSGFYVEKNDDGKLCIDRDRLQSRSGAKCEVERLRQLVAVED